MDVKDLCLSISTSMGSGKLLDSLWSSDSYYTLLRQSRLTGDRNQTKKYMVCCLFLLLLLSPFSPFLSHVRALYESLDRNMAFEQPA